MMEMTQMDVFVEQLVRRRRVAADYIKVALCLVAAIAVVIVMLLSVVTSISPFVFLIGIGIIIILNKIKDTINIEYEYCFTNGSLDVDKIIAANRRGRLAEVNAREIEIMGTNKNAQYRSNIENRAIEKIYACSSLDADDVCYVIFEKDGNTKMLIFSPNEKIKDGFKRYNPRKVFLND